MQPEKTYREIDVFSTEKFTAEDVDYTARVTGVVILESEADEIAFVGTAVNDLFTLPGGGVETNESPAAGSARECQEETGYPVRIKKALGVVESYRPRWSKHYITHCFQASPSGPAGPQKLTANEKENGLYLKWFKPTAASDLLEKQAKAAKAGDIPFYNTCFNIMRDRYFLQKMLKTKS